MLWASTESGRSLASPRAKALCPNCGGDVIAKCGEHVAWHWAHVAKDCDPWTEPESEWHRQWKGLFPVEWQEKSFGPHRADVMTPKGVIEFQKSSISSEEIREREAFYKRMVWVLDASKVYVEHDSWSDYRRFYKWLYKVNYSLAKNWADNESLFGCKYLEGEKKEAYRRMECAVEEAKQRYKRRQTNFRYRWLWPAKSWKSAQKAIFFDFGERHLRADICSSNFAMATNFSWTLKGGCYFDLKFIDKSVFVSQCS